MMSAATILQIALAEDAPQGDLTTRALGLANEFVTASIVSRSEGVFAGASVLDAIGIVAPTIAVSDALNDGAMLLHEGVITTLHGPAEDVLLLERSVLNLLSHLCGVATLTHRYVSRVAHTSAQIYDTRKTTPGIRLLEREAVRAGGGHNHRSGLSDAVLIKDNHLATLGTTPERLPKLLQSVRNVVGPDSFVTLEVDRLDQLRAVVGLGLVDNVLLDNFSLADLANAVSLRMSDVAINADFTLEASGGITLDTVAAVAATGVDRISLGALTHSALPLDLGLDFVRQS